MSAHPSVAPFCMALTFPRARRRCCSHFHVYRDSTPADIVDDSRNATPHLTYQALSQEVTATVAGLYVNGRETHLICRIQRRLTPSIVILLHLSPCARSHVTILLIQLVSGRTTHGMTSPSCRFERYGTTTLTRPIAGAR